MADDLEKAILLVFEPSANPALKSQALACRDPAALLRLTVDLLHRTALSPVRFRCLQSLHDAVPLLPVADLPLLHSSLLSLASSPSSPVLSPCSPPFLKNKLTQALAALVCHLYPAPWLPSPFLDLLPRLADGPQAIDIFSRLPRPWTMISSAWTTPARVRPSPLPPGSRMPCGARLFPRLPVPGSISSRFTALLILSSLLRSSTP